MLTPDEIAKDFEQELLSRSEEERIKYLKQLGFSIVPAKVKQRASTQASNTNRYINIVDKKAKRAVRGSVKKEGHLQVN
jgi:hypothetical protein